VWPSASFGSGFSTRHTARERTTTIDAWLEEDESENGETEDRSIMDVIDAWLQEGDETVNIVVFFS
jgi:hypothetical protein